MIAHPSETRARRTEVLNRLAEASRTRLRAPQAEHNDAGVGGLCAALTDLGPVFASYGEYLASRGDLLPPKETRRLTAVGREVAQEPSTSVRAILQTEASKVGT